MSNTPQRPRGVPPLGDGDEGRAQTDWEGLTANEFMLLKIQERTEKGMTRDRAAKSVFAAYPGLREAVIAEANAGRRIG